MGWPILRLRRRRQVQENHARPAFPNADLYQLLAYATAEHLPGGLLIYAEGEDEPREYTVRHARKRLEVITLDLSGTLEGTLARVKSLSQKVIALRVGQ